MKKIWPLLVVLILSLGAVRPLLVNGFFPIHDDTQVVRVQQMGEALRDGQFPVRQLADLGYGYGYSIFNFYAPLAYYFGGGLCLLGFNALLATKMMMLVGVLLAGITMFLLAREFWGVIGGIVAALFYLYAPYHAVDIYVRGAVGEFWAMAWLPLVFYGLKRRSWIISGLAYAAVILSHNLTALMLTIFLFIIILIFYYFSQEKRQFIIHNSKFIILALGTSAFYWLPALTEMKLTQVFSQIGAGADWREHFVYLRQLWDSPWGFAGSAPGPWDGMSLMIGKLHLIMAGVAALICLKTKFQQRAIGVTLGILIFAVFLMSRFSAFIWQLAPLMSFIQYPWRFLVLATAASSFLAGSAAWWLNQQGWRGKLGVGLVILILLTLNAKFFQPERMLSFGVAEYVNEENIKWTTSRISDEYLPRDFPVSTNRDEAAWKKVVVLAGEVAISDLISKSHRLNFEVTANPPTGGEILINTAYFPGWRLWMDGQEQEPQIQAGKIKLSLPAGRHQVNLRFTNTPIRTLANLISLITWLGLAFFMLRYSYG